MAERPHISFVMPCYNEEEILEYTLPRLVNAFVDAGHRFELIAVDNGSSDRTGEIIQSFVDAGLPVVRHRIEVNEGYGNGLLRGIPLAKAPWIGFIPADGQVDAEDVVRLYESVQHSSGRVLGKVRRRFRMDGPVRWVVSVTYNLFMLMLWPRLGSLDVNGSPKIIHADVIEAMRLESKDWLLDAELMIKACMMGIRCLEMNVFSRMREAGASHVDSTTVWEFITRLLGFRFGPTLGKWWRSYQARDQLDVPTI